MSDIEKKFHEFALQSILFKGRSDWYFCYLKAEKIAHVLSILAERAEVKERDMAFKLVTAAADLPHTFAHFAAGEVDAAVVVADIFSLLSKVRLATTGGFLEQENGAIISNEYEMLAERFSASVHPSPFAGLGDFSVPEVEVGELPQASSLGALPSARSNSQGHTDKGQSKGRPKESGQGHSDRTSKILAFVRANKESSIKDIAAVIKDCSEKTIQRELALLIEEGLIKKVGERRWSVYIPL